MKPKISYVSDDLRPEYNFDYSRGVRGKYYKRMLKGGQTSRSWNPMSRKPFQIQPR